MKKALLLFVTTLLMASIAIAQSNYSFSYSVGTYTEITGGTVLGGEANDDERFVDPANLAGGTTLTGPGFPIGFNFWFGGEFFDRLAINSNGWISLGKSSLNPAVNNSTTSAYTPLSSTTAITPDVLVSRIAAFGRDLQAQAGATLRLQTIGTAPNRVCVIQWKNYRKYLATGDSYNFQIRLYEIDGRIEFVYGLMLNNATSTTAHVGLRGAPSATASNFANRETTTNWAATTPGATAAATCTLSNTVFPADGATFTFNPPAPCTTPAAQPTALNLTPAFTSISGSFTAAAGVDQYLVVHSTSSSLTALPVDGTVYSVGQPLGGGIVDYFGAATNFTTPNNLYPTTTYYFFVFSVNHATCSFGPKYLTASPLTGSAVTTSPGNIVSAGSGLWGDASTWAGGTVPTATDNVTILDGHTVTVNLATNVCWNLTINEGGTVNTTGTTNKLTVNNNLVNNGTLNLYVDPSNAADLTFGGTLNATFTGTGAVTDLHTLTINKGSGTVTISSPMIEVMPSNLTIRDTDNSTVSTGGFLQTTTFNGIVKFSGTYTLTNTVFAAVSYTIPASGGLWINNPNFTVAGMNGTPTLNGLLGISAGTFVIGTAANNALGFGSGSKIYIEGGTVIARGRFGVASAANTILYSQTGGDVLVATVEFNNSTALASFDLGTSATSTINLAGGTITIQFNSTATSGPRDFRGPSTGVFWPSMLGTTTTLYLGNAATNSIKTFFINGSVPPMVINSVPAGPHNVSLGASVYYYSDLTIPAGSTLNLNGFGFWLRGNMVNDGTIVGTTTNSRFDFANALFGETTPQTYSGSGVFGTASAPVLSTGFNNVGNIILNGPVFSLRANMFRGTLVNSNNLTLGNGTTGAVITQLGVSLIAPGGSFDTYPTFNLGTGTYTILYTSESVPRTTGFEIPATRQVTNVTINNPNGVTLEGGDLTLGSATVLGTLTLTTGILHTGSNTVILANSGTTVSGGSATSFVNGKLVRYFAASRTATGTYTTATLFPIGKGTTFMPLHIDPTTTAGGMVAFSGEAFLSNSGTMGPGVTSLSSVRWEAPVYAGSANLTSTFLRIGHANIVSGNQILQASSGAGVYGAIPSVSLFATGTPPTLTTTGIQIPAASYFGFLAYGDLTTCDPPTAQPTNFTTSYMMATGFVGSFTAASPPASHYLVVRYATGGTVTHPTNFTNYTVGQALGAGTVRHSGVETTFSETGLVANTTYDYYVYSYNNAGCYGPVYYTVSPLFAQVTTCATAVGTPGTPTASNLAITSFTANWTASSTPDVTYLLDVATNSTFTSFVPGYQELNVGTALSQPVTGLTGNTTYFVRVRATTGTCYSPYSGTLTVTTLCNAYSTPFVENFDLLTWPQCWNQTFAGGVTSNRWNVNATNNAGGTPNEMRASWVSGVGISRLILPPIDLSGAVAGARLEFRHFYDDYGAGATMRVQSSTNLIDWTNEAFSFVSGGGNIGPAAVTVPITNLSATSFIAFVIDGDHYQIDFWYIDNVKVVENPAIDLAFTQFYQSSGLLNRGEGSLVEDFSVSMAPEAYKGDPQTEELDMSANGVASSQGCYTNIIETKDGGDATRSLNPVEVKARIDNIGIQPASYNLDWTVGGVAQSTYNGPSINPASHHIATLYHTPSARGMFFTNGQISVTNDGNPDNNSNQFRMRVYPNTYNRTIYDRGDNQVDVYVGWNNPSIPMTAAVRFTANDYIRPAGVDFICRTETVTAGTFTVRVRAAGPTNQAPGAILYTRTYTDPVYFFANGGYVHFAFEDIVPTIAPGSDYWITIEAPLGVLYPGGVHNDGFTPGRSFYYSPSTDTWVPLVITTERAWIMRSVHVAGVVPGCPVPINLAVSNISATSALISWSPYGDETFFNIQVGAPGFIPEVNPLNEWTNIEANSFYIENELDPYTTYHVYVQSVCDDIGDKSDWSGPIAFTTLELCPSPSNINMTNVFPTSAQLNWTVNGAETQWDIEWGATPYTFTGTPTQTITQRPYILTGLQPGTSYTLRIRANCGFGDVSLWQGPVNFTTPVASGTPWFEGFATTSTPDQWTTTGWIIGSSMSAFAAPMTNMIYKNLWSSATSGVFNTISVGPIVAGMGLYFDYRLANYASPYGPPAAGSGNYVVAISTNFGTTYTNIETVTNNGVAGWQYKYYDLSAYAGQYVRIRITGTWISGDYWLAFDNFYIGNCPMPYGLAAANITPFTADISWTPQGSESNWNVKYGAPGFDPATQGTLVPTSTIPVTLTGLTKNTPYQVYVQANCGTSLVSPWRGVLSFTTTESCLAPTAPAGVALSTTSASLNWTANGSETTWDIEYGAVPYTFTGTPSFSTTDKPHILTGLSPNTQYTFRVRANCGGGDFSTWSTAANFTTPCEAFTVPFFEGFETGHTHNQAIANCWTQQAITGSGVWTANNTLTTYNRAPRTGAWNAFLAYSNTRWMFQRFALEVGKTYTFTMWARQDMESTALANITVAWGTAGNAASMTNIIVPETGLTNGPYQQLTGTFTVPDNGNYFVGIRGSITSTPWYISIDDISITAAPTQYTIVASAGPNGTIDPVGNVLVNHGANQLFAITPDPGYYIADVLVNGQSVGAVTAYEFTNVTSNQTIHAIFAINTYTIVASAGPNGTIDPVGNVLVNHGANQAFNILPDAGYEVDDVLVNGSSVGAVTYYLFTNVTANQTIHATFKLSGPPTTLNVTGIFGGTDCLDATETITFSDYTLLSGAVLDVIAGQNIIFQGSGSGVVIESGAYMWARITTTSTYCSKVLPIIASKPAETPEQPYNTFFRVFPNPTTGMFTLELLEATESELVVEVYGAMGERLLKQQLNGFKQHDFDLGGKPSGMYIIRVYKDGQLGTEKLIKR